jgi:carotenoid 1,2-hydratase
MRNADLRAAQAVRTGDRTAEQRDGGDDAERLRVDVPRDGRGALRSGVARMDGLVPPLGGALPNPGTVLRGGQHASGSRRADGGDLGTTGGGSSAVGPRFDAPVAPGGYVWWYVDALSDDGRHGLTIIAFVGSVFSPYYALARRWGTPDPENFCALNVALYGESNRWAMTERSRAKLHRGRSSLMIGPSLMAWDGDALTIRIEEITAPIPSALRGVVRVYPKAITNRTFLLDSHGRHRWRPIAPSAHVQVAMERPAILWQGTGYLDTNAGDEPLEDAFAAWHWSRADLRPGTGIFYDVAPRAGSAEPIALHVSPAGEIEAIPPPPLADLPTTAWKIARKTRSDSEAPVRVLKTLENTPFYARSLLSAHIHGRPATVMQESLSLDRFRCGWVQAMLPFRMPRAWR